MCQDQEIFIFGATVSLCAYTNIQLREEGGSCSYNDLRLDGDTNSGFGSSSANSHSSVMDLLKHCCYFLFSAFLLTSPTQYWTMKAARKHESRIIHSSINVTTQPQPTCYVVLWIIRAGFLGKRKSLTQYKRLSIYIIRK